MAVPAYMIIPVLAAMQTTGDVQFNGLILDSCTVLVLTAGTLAVNTDGDLLSSENLGGLPGTATVTSTGLGYDLSISAPTGFDSAPTDGGTNTTFDASFSSLGTTIDPLVEVGDLLSLGLGISTLTINASAEKSTGIFPAGTYEMTATLTCSG